MGSLSHTCLLSSTLLLTPSQSVRHAYLRITVSHTALCKVRKATHSCKWDVALQLYFQISTDDPTRTIQLADDIISVANNGTLQVMRSCAVPGAPQSPSTVSVPALQTFAFADMQSRQMHSQSLPEGSSLLLSAFRPQHAGDCALDLNVPFMLTSSSSAPLVCGHAMQEPEARGTDACAGCAADHWICRLGCGGAGRVGVSTSSDCAAPGALLLPQSVWEVVPGCGGHDKGKCYCSHSDWGPFDTVSAGCLPAEECHCAVDGLP